MSDLQMDTIEAAWLRRPSPEVAPDLLGCLLVRRWEDGRRLKGMIVETEAYAPGDPACHAYRRKTPRNGVMFGPPGHSYVYFIYGMYHCLNVVTDGDGVPSAVLIRALQLLEIPPWLTVPPRQKAHRLAAGPGKLCRVMEIERSLNGIPFHPQQALWLEPPPEAVQTAHITQTTRIGLTQGAEIPWRWYLTDSPAVSKR
jgi:DNA-3-methyladenine glycosylase